MILERERRKGGGRRGREKGIGKRKGAGREGEKHGCERETSFSCLPYLP